jgi:putative FmdB family regulatory protein
MPIYEFKCKACGLKVEEICAPTAQTLARPPVCAQGGCEFERCLSVFHARAGGQAPSRSSARDNELAAVAAASAPPSERSKAPHVCTKYCEHH